MPELRKWGFNFQTAAALATVGGVVIAYLNSEALKKNAETRKLQKAVEKALSKEFDVDTCGADDRNIAAVKDYIDRGDELDRQLESAFHYEEDICVCIDGPSVSGKTSMVLEGKKALYIRLRNQTVREAIYSALGVHRGGLEAGPLSIVHAPSLSTCP